MKLKSQLIFTLIIFITISIRINSQSFTWLGTLGGDESEAFAVSNDGSIVVGESKNSNDEDRAFRWTVSGGMQTLSGTSNIESMASSISSDGTIIVGTTEDEFGTEKAFRWTETNSLEYLTQLGGDPFIESDAQGISADGSRIVGQIQNTSGEYRGFIWAESFGMKELDVLIGGDSTSLVNSIDGDGSLLVGWSSDENYNQRPVDWRDYISNAMPIPVISGNGVAEAISENGTYAVGRIIMNGNEMHGFRWHKVPPGYWDPEVDLGFLSGITNPEVCYALDVSDDGLVVGFTTGQNPNGIVAFLWGQINTLTNVMYDLNVVYSNLINQSGYLLQANAITPDGRFIVGQGYRPSLQRYEAFLLDRGEPTSVNESNLALDKYSLEQNYPNPFNPSTTISFSIPNESFVSLKIFNSLGEEVEELVNETKPAGKYSIDFNASELTSGVYFYRLRTKGPEINSGQGIIQTRKMILVK